jgi:hypothetical protein
MFLLPEAPARYWLRHQSVLDCTTWGDVRAIGPDVYVSVLGLAGDEELEEFGPVFSSEGELTSDPADLLDKAEALINTRSSLPDDSESLDLESLWGFDDGDWPPSVHVLMRSYVPNFIQMYYSIRFETVLQGTFVFIPAQYSQEVCDELTEAGHDVVQDEEMGKFAVLS